MRQRFDGRMKRIVGRGQLPLTGPTDWYVVDNLAPRIGRRLTPSLSPHPTTTYTANVIPKAHIGFPNGITPLGCSTRLRKLLFFVLITPADRLRPVTPCGDTAVVVRPSDCFDRGIQAALVPVAIRMVW